MAKRQRKKKSEPHLRGETVIADLTTLQPNGWNGNVMDELERESIKAGFRKEGWLVSQALTVWRTDETGAERMVIIDGEQRWTCALDIGLLTGPMVYLDGITEAEARKLTVQLYRRRGAWTDEGLAAALQPIELDIPTDSLELGFEPQDLAHLLDIDLSTTEEDDPRQRNRDRDRDRDGGGDGAGDVWTIVIECSGEGDQVEKLEELLERGWKCRPLI
jgi:ParB-like chromosome segregation protein Spo0J